MTRERILQTAQAIVNQKVSQYNDAADLGPLLKELQVTLTRFCDSFCDWVIMGENRFRLDLQEVEAGHVNINVILLFPLEGDIDVDLQAEVADE